VRILNFGSLNIDYVYSVNKFVSPGETISCVSYKQYCGGKGLNQSLALARAGADVWHAGKIGVEGQFLKDRLAEDGVKVNFVEVVDEPTGHAIIQVDAKGENAIVIYGGANQTVSRADAERVIGTFSPNDILLLQNEISAMPDILKLAADKGLRVAFNPAPFGPEVFNYPMQGVDFFIVNETEGERLTGKTEPKDIAREMMKAFPKAVIILTLGAKGASYMDGRESFDVGAQKVEAVDTTAAGDTFIGFFLTLHTLGRDMRACLETACKAATLCATRRGAADSIPKMKEVES